MKLIVIRIFNICLVWLLRVTKMQINPWSIQISIEYDTVLTVRLYGYNLILVIWVNSNLKKRTKCQYLRSSLNLLTDSPSLHNLKGSDRNKFASFSWSQPKTLITPASPKKATPLNPFLFWRDLGSLILFPFIPQSNHQLERILR